MKQRAFENIHFCHDAASDLTSIIAIHNTRRGPALGGCRFYPYPDTMAGIHDVMNLAEAMTLKASLADLPLGGGKSIIFGDPKTTKSQAKLEAFGRFVNNLGGRYITSVDSGTTPEDLNIFLTQTKHVTGMTASHGGSGDPSPTTALGTFMGIEACAEFAYGSKNLSGKTVALQGVGNVGRVLGKYLVEAGAQLIVADFDAKKAQDFKKQFPETQIQDHTEILSAQADILAPCAMGGVIDSKTIENLNCKILAGAANNPLATMDIADQLHTKGIVYAPDFAINAGGLIHVADELEGFSHERIEKKTRNIYKTILNILVRADKENVSPAIIARTMAREQIPAS